MLKDRLRLAPPQKRIWLSIAASCLLLGAFLLFWRGPMPFEGLVLALARIDEWHEAPAASNRGTLRLFYSLSVGIASLAAGLLIASRLILGHLSERSRGVIYGVAVTLACSCSLIVYLLRMKHEGPWMRIDVVMNKPNSLPIFGHRLLFVWLAKAFQAVVPKLSPLRSFYFSQCVAIVLTVYALGEWSALHIGKAVKWVGQILGIVLISTCFTYYNFYDIGNVFFSTCGLYAIYTRRYWWLVPVVMIGTLNYEGVLLLIPAAVFAAHRQDPIRRWAPAIATSAVAYSAVRFALQSAIPFSRHVDWRIWSNMTGPFVNRAEMAYCILALAGWYSLGWMSFRYCDQRLKRLTIIFPLILIVTVLFGQLHEPRQFDAFIPILVAMILSVLRRQIALEGQPTTSDSLALEPEQISR